MTNAPNVNELAGEVADANFADDRLNNRLRNLVGSLAKAPKKSLPKALDGAGLEGAYRFVSNPRVTPERILSGHLGAAVERCEGEPTVLIAHDSTSFSYRYDGEREGLGRVQRGNERSRQNFFAHFSLALTADGERRPLGVLGFEPWSRVEEPTGTEYQRWEKQMRATSQMFSSAQKAIHLADREADDYEMFWALQRDQYRFVVRCQFNRLLQEGEQTTKLHDHFANSAALVERSVPLSKRAPKRCATMSKIYPPRNERLARLSVAGATVQLKKPTKARPHGVGGVPSTVTINVVRVWEPAPPQGEEPIEWYLYTSEPIETAEQQLAVVDYYRARWVIE
ncbi:MAG TPA: IS4 family transposase, partial [Polyangiaceae bacterium]